MIQPPTERRGAPRHTLSQEIELVSGAHRFPAALTNISATGLQAQVDPSVYDVSDGIDAVRLGAADDLALTVHWGIFDGRFGATFQDLDAAAPQVESYLTTAT